MQDRFYWAALHSAVDLGPRSLLHLYRYFASGKEVLSASEQELQRVPMLSSKVIERILFFRKFADAERTSQELSANNIKLILQGDADYPKRLEEIADPPVILYLKGVLPAQEMPLIAIVGARQATPYGMTVAKQLAQDFAEIGWGVVSGMARGVDTGAHIGALAGNGYTLAVFGCGINICYPPENQKLRDQIRALGGLVSEFPPDANPSAENFPIRNRIISGCSLGALVVEAGEKSGALITAYLSLEQGREVFAVPGHITNSRSRGTHALIKQGAKLVETINDVLAEFPYLHNMTKNENCTPKATAVSLQKEEGIIFQKLSLEPVHIDQLAESTGLTVSVVGGLLTMLEVKGLAKRLPGHYFIKHGACF